MKTYKAKEDMWLTQKDDVSDSERMYVREICAPDDYTVEWRDADQQEKDAWEERMNAIIEEEEEEYGGNASSIPNSDRLLL